MNIIDSHTHFFPNKLFDAIWKWFEANAWPIEYKIYADDIVSILKQEGVKHAVSLFYPHNPRMALPLNEYNHTLANKYPNFIIPFGSLHPDDSNKNEILKICFERYKFKGLKFHCHVQKFAPNDQRMDKVYEICNEQKKIVLIHCGTGPNFKDLPTDGYGYDVESISGVKLFEKVIKRYPHITFIVPHLGFDESREFLRLTANYPNLYFDTSMTFSDIFPHTADREYLDQYADRILFGTDMPNIPHPWRLERDRILALNLGQNTEKKIFYQNAARILGLNQPNP